MDIEQRMRAWQAAEAIRRQLVRAGYFERARVKKAVAEELKRREAEKARQRERVEEEKEG